MSEVPADEPDQKQLRKRILNAERCRRYRERHPDRIEAQREKKNERSKEYQKIPEVRQRRNKNARLRNILKRGRELGYESIPVRAEFEGVEQPYGEDSTVVIGGDVKIIPVLRPLGTAELPTAKAFETDPEKATRRAYYRYGLMPLYEEQHLSKAEKFSDAVRKALTRKSRLSLDIEFISERLHASIMAQLKSIRRRFN
jgi:hypothetical protein